MIASLESILEVAVRLHYDSTERACQHLPLPVVSTVVVVIAKRGIDDAEKVIIRQAQQVGRTEVFSSVAGR